MAPARTLPALLLTFTASLALTGVVASAATLGVVEHQITTSAFYETTPTLGNDGTDDLVVYTSRELLSTGFFDQGDIWYQRLDADGAPAGAPVQVTSDLTDDKINDNSGDYIVYTAYESTMSLSGTIMLYRISTGDDAVPLGNADIIHEPRIYGNKVVWRDGGGGATRIMMYDLSWLGTSTPAEVLAGPTPPTFDVEIGDRFVVWSELVDEDRDVVAYDPAEDSYVTVTDTDNVHEAQTGTSGPWIVWQARYNSGPPPSYVSRIEAYNVDTAELRTLVDDGAFNRLPNVDGDLVSWESNAGGDYDVYVYRLSTEETFTVTEAVGDQILNDVFGDLVAYVDESAGNDDIYVAKIEFLAPDIDVAPPTLDFGMVDIGDSSQSIVTVTNVGDADLTVSDVLLSAGSHAAFAIEAPLAGDLPAVVAPDGTLDIAVSFTPDSQATVAASLEIASDDPDEALVTVDLVGEGVPLDDPVMSLLDEIFDPAVEAGTIVGDGPGNSAQGRLGALRNMIEAAGDLVDDGFIDEACDQLLDALNRTDGEFPPPDFVNSPAGLPEEAITADDLAAGIEQLRVDLGCLDEAVSALREADAAPDPPARRPRPCGLGAELALLLPPLMWLYRSQRRRV